MSAPVVVLGAGVNGLVAAHYLARAGRRVLVLERRPEEGGAGTAGTAGTAQAPEANGAPTASGWVPPAIVQSLGLAARGLRIERPDPWVAAPLEGGGRLELWRDVGKSAEAIRRLSPADAAKWPEFCARMARLAGVMEALYAAPPPDVTGTDIGELLRLAALGWRVRRLGRQGVVDLLRILPMSVAELLDDWFENDALKGILGAAGILHFGQGPRSGGTAFLMLHHHVGSPPGVFRPPATNVWAVLHGLPGVEVRWGAEVKRVLGKDGRATGVALESGEEIAAAAVVSGLDPRRTLLQLADPGWLDPDVAHAVRNIRARGVVARVTLALDRAALFPALVLAPSLAYLERAWDDAKHGRVSARPFIEARATASGGHHRVEAHVQFAPYALQGGAWDEARRRALGELALATLAERVPELKGAVSVVAVESPRDLEAAYGWPEGNAYHAEPALDQLLFMRPVPACARYRTPIGGLYLCGPGTHPGGGIAGASGANAALIVLRDLRAGSHA